MNGWVGQSNCEWIFLFLKETTYPGWESNPVPPDIQARVLTTRPIRLTRGTRQNWAMVACASKSHVDKLLKVREIFIYSMHMQTVAGRSLPKGAFAASDKAFSGVVMSIKSSATWPMRASCSFALSWCSFCDKLAARVRACGLLPCTKDPSCYHAKYKNVHWKFLFHINDEWY